MKNIIAILLATVFVFSISCTTMKSKIEKARYSHKKLKWAKQRDNKNNLAGFRVYLAYEGKKGGKLLKEIKDPKATEVSLSSFADQLDFEKANYIYITAYDKKNNESGPSGKVCWGKPCKKK